MIRLGAALLIAACAAAPARAADPVMTAETCRIGWQAFADLTEQPQYLRAVTPDVTETGWCRIDKANAELTAQDFEVLDWRAEGVLAAVENGAFPLSLQVVSGGIDLVQAFGMPLPAAHRGTLGDLTLRAHRVPATRAFAIDDLTARFGPLGGFTLAVRGGGIDLSTLPMMQFTLGGLRLTEASLDLRTTAVLSGAFVAPLLREMTGTDLAALVPALPDTAIDEASRAALAAFAGALPDAAGRLDLTARAEPGFGVLQLVAGAKAMAPEAGGNPADALEILLSGVRLTVRWTPEGG